MLVSSILMHCRPRSKINALNNNISNYLSHRSFNNSFNLFRLQLHLQGGKFYHRSSTSQDDDNDVASQDDEEETASSPSSSQPQMRCYSFPILYISNDTFRCINNRSFTYIAVYHITLTCIIFVIH